MSAIPWFGRATLWVVSAIDHLRAARAALAADRDRLTRELHVIDQAIIRLEEAYGGGDAANDDLPRIPLAPSVRDAILDAVGIAGHLTLPEMAAAVRLVGNNASYDSVAAMASKLTLDRYLVRVGRGVYSLALPESEPVDSHDVFADLVSRVPDAVNGSNGGLHEEAEQ